VGRRRGCNATTIPDDMHASDSIDSAVIQYDYGTNPATRRNSTVSTPTAKQVDLWRVGAGRLRSRKADSRGHDGAAETEG